MKKKLSLFILVYLLFSLLLAPTTEAAGTPGCQIERLIGGAECKSRLVVTPFEESYCGETEESVKAKYGASYPTYGCCCNESGRDIVNQTGVSTNKEKKPIKPSIFGIPDLSVTIPGLDKFEPVKCDTDNNNCSIPWLAQYIGGLQRYAIGIVGIVAVITLMMGGVIWLTAGGSPEKIGEAKNWITGSLIGLTLTLASYLILYTINPELTVLKNINITYIGKVDLEEVKVENIATINENLNKPGAGGLGNTSVSNYCGCFTPHDTYNTSTLKTAEQVKELIRSMKSNSPLIDYAQNMIDSANKYGIDPVLIVVKAKNENSLGTASSTCVKHHNIGSIKCSGTSGCKQYDCVTAGNGIKYRSYPSWAEGIEDYFCFMKNSNTGQAPSMRELITRYCPPCTQKDGCCYTGKYIDTVVSYIQKYNTKNYDFDKPNGSNCSCYDLKEHCKNAQGSPAYCDK